MKVTMVLLVAFVLMFPILSHAELIDEGDTVYDSNSELTWIKDANLPKTMGIGYEGFGLMHWADAVAWVSQLNYGGYSDWRLPNGFHADGSIAMNFDSIDTEYGSLFYGNGISLSNPGPFTNLQDPHPRGDITSIYWTGTTDPRNGNSFAFWFTNGGQVSDQANGLNWIMICRNDVEESMAFAFDSDSSASLSIPQSVPEPSTFLLLIPGLLLVRKIK